MRFTCLLLLLVTFVATSSNEPQSSARQKADQRVPLPPRDELGTFQVNSNFTIELVACEPDIVDPVCFCFDARGDLYVVEMRGYPNGGKGEGQPNYPGRVRKLQDLDGDGYYETSSIFVDQLRFPCAITPCRDGFLIGDAPDLLFVADRRNSGKADHKEVLYTGFGNSNIQQMINGLQLHVDGWVYGCNGGNDSPVRSVQKPENRVVQLKGMHFRFKPDVPGSLEPTSGGGQYGLAATTSGHWLTCTNSQHLRHIILPYQYLKRNQELAVSAVTLDIPDHDAAARVYRISPFEAWRVERTTRRAGSTDAKRFPSTELVPGGFITSACGLAVIDSETFPKQFAGNVLVCDPANNLIHRDVLAASGSTYRAERHDKDCEFLASTDTWFRPVFIANGPDGSMYVADFYREIIETPLSLPDDIKAKWNLNSRERGRIWRIKPKSSVPPITKKATLQSLSTLELTTELESPVGWRRETAHRLLFERPSKEQEVIAACRRLLDHGPAATAVAALFLLDRANSLADEFLATLLAKPNQTHEAVLLAALRIAEDRRQLSSELRHAIQTCAETRNQHVRFQLSLSAGSLALTTEEKLSLIKQLVSLSELDHWMETALLSSVSGSEQILLMSLLTSSQVSITFLERLAQLTSRKTPMAELINNAQLQQALQKNRDERALAIIRGLGTEYAKSLSGFAPSLTKLLHEPSLSATRQRLAISLLSYGSWQEIEPSIRELLSPQSPLEVQQQAIQAIKKMPEPRVAVLLLELWPGWSPTLRREAQELLLSRPSFVELVLDRAEKGSFDWRQLDLARREQLLRARNSSIQKRASQLQAKIGTSNRSQVLVRYAPALNLTGNIDRGKSHFSKQCAGCHQIDGIGHIVGPDLRGALSNKTSEGILIDILDPNREVDPRYVNYVIVTKSGRTVTGMISNETANSMTLKRAEGIEETILRNEIEEVQGTGKSLMPENLEEQLSLQDAADIISYLLAVRSKK